MIRRFFSFVIVMFLVTSSAAFAAGDPMKSLFLFQQKMADKGSTSAMMKMGEMYERGEGVEKSMDNALKMYEQAKAKGNPKADAAIQRLKNMQNKSSGNANHAAEEQAKKQRAQAAEKLRKEQEAAAAKKKAAKLAEQQALREKQNKENLAKAKAAKEAKAAQAAKDKAAREAKDKAAKEAKAKAIAAKAKAAKEAKARAIAKAARIAAEKKRKEASDSKEGFKSDPCKGKAARLLSICK